MLSHGEVSQIRVALHGFRGFPERPILHVALITLVSLQRLDLWIHFETILVGGWPTPLNFINPLMGRIIPYIMEHKKIFETTNQYLFHSTKCLNISLKGTKKHDLEHGFWHEAPKSTILCTKENTQNNVYPKYKEIIFWLLQLFGRMHYIYNSWYYLLWYNHSVIPRILRVTMVPPWSHDGWIPIASPAPGGVSPLRRAGLAPSRAPGAPTEH